jgi:hypothetical protein
MTTNRAVRSAASLVISTSKLSPAFGQKREEEVLRPFERPIAHVFGAFYVWRSQRRLFEFSSGPPRRLHEFLSFGLPSFIGKAGVVVGIVGVSWRFELSA